MKAKYLHCKKCCLNCYEDQANARVFKDGRWTENCLNWRPKGGL